MKKTLLILLFPLLSIGQTQIGADIDGKAASGQSGTSVSVSGDGTILAVGAMYGTSPGYEGYVSVYKNISGTWTQIGSDIKGETSGDYFGYSVSLSNDGSILAIGAWANDGNGSESGSVRVYKNISGTWTKIGSDIDGETFGSQSGYSVSLSSDGSILAIGAPGNNGNGTSSGSVRVYKNVSGTWTKVGNDIDGDTGYHYTGREVSLSSDGSILVIGGDDFGGRVFQNISGTWTKIGAGFVGGQTTSLSADGSVLAVQNPFSGGSSSGAVSVYKNISGTWTQVGSAINGENANDYSGDSISLSADGSIVAIGTNNNSSKGSVRVYKNVSGTWIKVGSDIDGEALYDSSGSSVSLSTDGSILAIGAPTNDGNGTDSGSVRVYNLSTAIATVLSSDSFVLAHFSVYPNPASDVVTISLQEGLTLEKVNVYNTLGQLVKTENKDVIAVTSLAKGSYFFEVITNKGKATKQILVK